MSSLIISGQIELQAAPIQSEVVILKPTYNYESALSCIAGPCSYRCCACCQEDGIMRILPFTMLMPAVGTELHKRHPPQRGDLLDVQQYF